jgi:hypothetical protein
MIAALLLNNFGSNRASQIQGLLSIPYYSFFPRCSPPFSQVQRARYLGEHRLLTEAQGYTACVDGKQLHKKEESEKRWYMNNEKQSNGAVFLRMLDR